MLGSYHYNKEQKALVSELYTLQSTLKEHILKEEFESIPDVIKQIKTQEEEIVKFCKNYDDGVKVMKEVYAKFGYDERAAMEDKMRRDWMKK